MSHSLTDPANSIEDIGAHLRVGGAGGQSEGRGQKRQNGRGLRAEGVAQLANHGLHPGPHPWVGGVSQGGQEGGEDAAEEVGGHAPSGGGEVTSCLGPGHGYDQFQQLIGGGFMEFSELGGLGGGWGLLGGNWAELG